MAASFAAAQLLKRGFASSGTQTLRRQKVALVQGASRGIGLELTKQLAERGDFVFATCRRPDEAADLVDLQESFPQNIRLQKLDVTDVPSIAAAAKAIEGELSELQRSASSSSASSQDAVGIDLLLNTAGVLQDKSIGLIPERGLHRVDADAVAKSFAVNAIGPLVTMQKFAPLLRRAASANQGTSHVKGQPGATAIFYSARVGSIGDNRRGGWHSYRASKAALNQFVRCIAVEMSRHNICCIALHPGTVDTDLTRAFSQARAEYDVQTVPAAAMRHLEIIESLSMQDSGNFYDWKREVVPW
eukprot:TRINITY_DN100475_c0_g1_i1.p1 TRINITY_DN100475_c0_g1~~TRINITY_DN100475_c0_g1_i1.p1  ORF type:complete len:302 (-),score=27.24 TRINITY_DN100475_c0_g1_i1:68-973(-)